MFKKDWRYSINPKTFDDIDPIIFKNVHLKTLFNYVFGIWVFVILKLAFLASDLFTCVKLLAFNSWSNNIIKPYIPFRISKWLFSGCILVSIILLLWNIVGAIRIYRTRNIAFCYVNNITRNSISITNYSKFCIFDRISSRGRFQWFAFFVFFELKSCLGLLLADTPRQVINGLTLWSVLITVHSGADGDMSLDDLESFDSLINKIKSIAQQNHEEAVVLSLNLFSFIIWLFFIAKFMFALICSIFVYYRLIKEREYDGLREYVHINISKHVDELIAEREKEYNNKIYKTSLLSNSSSILELDDLERDISLSNQTYQEYNDSFISFHHNNKYSNRILFSNDEVSNNEMQSTVIEPVPLVSTIRNQGNSNVPSFYGPSSKLLRKSFIGHEVHGLSEEATTKEGYAQHFANDDSLQDFDGSGLPDNNNENDETDDSSDMLNHRILKVSNNISSDEELVERDVSDEYSIKGHMVKEPMISLTCRKNYSPVPPQLNTSSTSQAVLDAQVFTPARAYFREGDFEESPFLPQDRDYSDFVKGNNS